MIHYRDLAGRDLGVKDTPRNRSVMSAAIAWVEAHIDRGAATYIWDEDGLLYFGGPWLGTSDLINGVYVPRGRADRRTSWAAPRPGWSSAAFDRLAERILRGGASTATLLAARERFDRESEVAGLAPWAGFPKAWPSVAVHLADRARRGPPNGAAASALRDLVNAEGVSLSRRADRALRFAEKAEAQ